MNTCVYNGVKVSTRHLISVYNGSFLYGINCFEGLRGYWDSKVGQLHLLDLDNHLERLFESANRLKFIHRWRKEELKAELVQLVLKENIKENVYVRITFFVDGETSWMECENISYLISIRSMDSTLNQDCKLRKYSLRISTYRRNSESSTPPSIKAGGNYLNSRYAKLEANESGFDDALILNQDGIISESTGSCIFFIKDGKLLTPSLDCDILPSITRRRVIALCSLNGIEVLECRLKPESISDMDGAFLCGSMIEIVPISQIDNTSIRTSELNLFRKVFDIFRDSLSIAEI